jgi:plastocyanin
MNKKLLVAMAAVALICAACGSDPDLVGVGASGPAAKPTKVVALDNVFGNDGADVRVGVGSRVTWDNDGHNDHDIVPIGTKEFGVNSKSFAPGHSYSHTFTKAGVYEYFCSLHGNKHGGMKGRILVGDAAAPKPTEDKVADIPAKASGNTVKVPADQPTIQKAVDAADPGDLILISPGTYHEAVDIPESKPYLTIRGLDRNKTILDGKFKLANGFKIVKAKGVAIENITAKNFTKNGFFWTGVEGYRGSYLTAIRNGDYGVYSFESTKGQFDHSYSTGSPDAGFYIGGCQPCDAVITDVLSEWNGLGYSGTNAGGNLLIVNSTWRHNRAGIVPNSGSYEPNAPQRGNTIVGNLVYDNNNGKTPAIDISITAMGNGILSAGGSDNVIERNRVWKHNTGGIAIITYPEGNGYTWKAVNNKVRENIVSDSGLFDIGYWYGDEKPDAHDNCFADNQYATTAPSDLEAVAPCEGTGTLDFTKNPLPLGQLATNDGKPGSVDYRKADLPPVPDQPNMPDADTAKGNPAIDVPVKIDVDSIKVPDAPS